MLARIYRPSPPMNQSQRESPRQWVLEFESKSASLPDPLMGWPQTSNPDSQLRLTFATVEQAVEYCEKHRIPFQVQPEPKKQRVIKAYADNFAADRKFPWTH